MLKIASVRAAIVRERRTGKCARISGVLSAFAIALSVHADPVRGVRAIDAKPMAPRGGVMMLPLTADRAGDNWPSELVLTQKNSEGLRGIVAWLGPVELSKERQWTDDPRGLDIRAIEPGDHNGNPASGAPVLLVRVPVDASGEYKLDRQTIKPNWRDFPATANDNAAPLERVHAPNRPDPDSPFEHWRWVLLAHELGMSAPNTASFHEPRALIAEHFASLWQIGLARLQQIDAQLAGRVRALLARTATDRGEPFAAWVASPAATGTLLTELLSERQSNTTLAEYVRLWIDEHDKPLVWPEADYDTTLRLAVLSSAASGLRDEMTLRFPGAAQSPTRLSIEPNVLMRVLAWKPPVGEDAVPELHGRQSARGESIVINLPGREIELPLRARRYAVVPPGVFFAELGPALSLVEVQTLQRLQVRADQATLVSVRKVRGRWEVFVDCRRAPEAVSAAAAQLPDRVATFDELRGIEAITLLIGPEKVEDGPGAILTVPEVGWPRVYFGVQDGSLQVHTRTHADRWYARIVLPDDWLPNADLGPALLGFIRTHSDSRAVETGPNSSLPWRIEPGRVALDLSEWDGAAEP